jgi:dephospho-CoA kinase
MAKIIIALTGEIACGKGTVTEYLTKKYQASNKRYSTMLRDLLARLYVQPSRESLASLSKYIRGAFGQDIMAKVMTKDIKKDKSEIIVLDGVRRQSDLEHIKNLPNFNLVYIETRLKKRYDRIINRGENSDDKGKSYNQFKIDHQLETERQIRALKKLSKYVINNNGTKERLYKQIDDLIETIKKAP